MSIKQSKTNHDNKYQLIIAILVALLVMVSFSYWNYFASIIGDQGVSYGTRSALCNHAATSYLKTVQNEVGVNDYSGKKWEMAIDVETELNNLCRTELTEKGLGEFQLNALKKYQTNTQ